MSGSLLNGANEVVASATGSATSTSTRSRRRAGRGASAAHRGVGDVDQAGLDQRAQQAAGGEVAGVEALGELADRGAVADRGDEAPLRRLDLHGAAGGVGDEGDRGPGAGHDPLDVTPLGEQPGGALDEALDVDRLGVVEAVDGDGVELEVAVVEAQQLEDELVEVADALVGAHGAVEDEAVAHDQLTLAPAADEAEPSGLGGAGDETEDVVECEGVDASLQSHGGASREHGDDVSGHRLLHLFVGTSSAVVEHFLVLSPASGRPMPSWPPPGRSRRSRARRPPRPGARASGRR